MESITLPQLVALKEIEPPEKMREVCWEIDDGGRV